MQHVLVTLQ